MDAYGLKSENRKKFQDKKKLNRRHETPSDRKYRLQHKKEEEAAKAEAEKNEPPKLKSNSDRYQEDETILLNLEKDELVITEATKKLKDVLSKQDQGEAFGELKFTSTDKLKRKDLNAMDVTELNALLNKDRSPVQQREMFTAVSEQSIPKHEVEKSNKLPTANINNKINTPSVVPEELAGDQDFLDGII